MAKNIVKLAAVKSKNQLKMIIEKMNHLLIRHNYMEFLFPIGKAKKLP